MRRINDTHVCNYILINCVITSLCVGLVRFFFFFCSQHNSSLPGTCCHGNEGLVVMVTTNQGLVTMVIGKLRLFAMVIRDFFDMVTVTGIIDVAPSEQ